MNAVTTFDRPYAAPLDWWERSCNVAYADFAEDADAGAALARS